jgi:hypothetical protein
MPSKYLTPSSFVETLGVGALDGSLLSKLLLVFDELCSSCAMLLS